MFFNFADFLFTVYFAFFATLKNDIKLSVFHIWAIYVYVNIIYVED